MTETEKPRVILLQKDENILEQAAVVLEDIGWYVIREKTSITALNRLKKSNKPFALFITDSKLPRMEGDEILKKVKKISPYTQRMIMLPESSTDILINAINKAKVNACITLPVRAADLIDLSKICLKKFRHSVKKAQLKRITTHQYKQLLDNAKKLKKRKAKHQHLIREKQALILKLKSKKRNLKRQYSRSNGLSLTDLIQKKNIRPTPQVLGSEFKLIAGLIKRAFALYIETHKGKTENSRMPELNLDVVFERCQKGKRSIFDNHGISFKEPSEQSIQKKGADTIDESQKSKQIRAILQAAFAEDLKSAAPKTNPASVEFFMEKHENQKDLQKENQVNDYQPLDSLFELTISENMTIAQLKRKKPNELKDREISCTDIIDFLRAHEISYGIIDDAEIEAWLESSSSEALVIASGEKSDPGRPGTVTYEFPTDYNNPGKIKVDGSIDFKDRGNPPFVKSGDILARKTPVREGKPGITVAGIPIAADELEEPAFEAGPGTTISGDGLTILADVDGQPQIDNLGTVSVSQDMVIDGDVDYETGHVNFHGNIIVKGRIKEGFKVTGASLTAQAVYGALIDVSGDLNISEGITNTEVSTAGNIHAQFINQSKVMAFGDVHISNDIIDSQIMISGKFINPGGSVIASKIWATLGIEAGMIGTASSDPPRLFVGTYSHIETLILKIDEILDASVNVSKQLKDNINKLETEEGELYEQIAEKTQIQDQAKSYLQEMLTELDTLKKADDLAQIPMVLEEIKTIKETVRVAEQGLNAIFETQDSTTQKIKNAQAQLSKSEEKNRLLVKKKKSLNILKKEIDPVPVVEVTKTIIEGSVIKSQRASVVIKEDRSRCRIHEIVSRKTGVPTYEIKLSDL